MEKSNVNIEKAGNNFVIWLRSNIVPLFLTALSIYFVFSGAVKMAISDLNWWEKICFIFTTMLFGIVISSLVSEGGYAAGKKDPDYVATRTEAVGLCDANLKFEKEANLFVIKKITEDIKNDRREVLNSVGVKYENVFDENGRLSVDKKTARKLYRRKQRKAIKMAARMKRREFTLFGFGAIKMVGRKDAPNEIKRRKNKAKMDFATRAIVAIATGSIMFVWIGMSLASVIYAMYQLMVWYGTGLVSRISNYNFIVIDMRNYDQERIWYLKKFQALPQTEKDELTSEVRKSEGKEETEKIVPPDPVVEQQPPLDANVETKPIENLVKEN